MGSRFAYVVSPIILQALTCCDDEQMQLRCCATVAFKRKKNLDHYHWEHFAHVLNF
jgi:hypothetical protein